jgi:Putative abortive phage resistance protein AbiGi, antitoxin
MKIEDILSRRNDLSSFVVHLTRKEPANGAGSSLKSILKNRCIEARNPFGMAVKKLKECDSYKKELDSQKVICFTETPLEHVYTFLAPIDGRSVEFGSYGLAFTKIVARRLGVNPVWYIDITPGHDWLTGPVNDLIEAQLKNGGFATSGIAKITPFVEPMGTNAGSLPYKKEFWWEREWRHHGDFKFELNNIALGFCPEKEIDEFEAYTKELDTKSTVKFIDPTWGLEQIIARLAGKSPTDVTPFCAV